MFAVVQNHGWGHLPCILPLPWYQSIVSKKKSKTNENEN
jgi:hypothetical protein